ncbi:MAG: TolC family protein [Alphaproteobacteria bacterium]
MHKTLVVWLCAILLASPARAEDDATGNTLTLKAAIARALTHSAQLQSANASLEASKGGRIQAGALPNPELGAEAENIAGNGIYSGGRSAEVTYGLSQKIELGGKRSAREDIADHEVDLATLDYTTTKLNLIRDVTIAYAEVISLNEEWKIANETKKLANDILQTVTKRVDAAREPLVQKSKAEVTLATSQIEANKLERSIQIAKKKLAALWDDSTANYDLEPADFFKIEKPTALTAPQNNPDIARLDAQVARSNANLELEKANAIPDLKVSAGVRDFRETNNRAFVIGLSMPIPIFDSNRGNIVKAQHEARKSESEKRLATLNLGTELTRANQGLETAYEEAEALKNTILPAAEKSFQLSREGYQLGKFSYLEVLDSQRTLFDTRRQYNNALKEYHTRKAEAERLTAMHLSKTDINGDRNEIR